MFTIIIRFLSNKSINVVPFLLFGIFLFGGFSYVGAEIPCAYTVQNVCGGETGAAGYTSPCASGYICSCIGTDCACSLDEATCGTADPSVVSCGDTGTYYECGTVGGCGPYQLECRPSGPGTGTCFVNYNCPCVVGVTCPGDAVCKDANTCDYNVDGTILNPNTGSDPSIFEILQYDGPIINNLPALLSPIFKLLFYVGIFIGILGIIYSGYLLMASEGDPGKAKEGKEQFTAAILGSLFILLSVVILRAIIDSILGVNSGL